MKKWNMLASEIAYIVLFHLLIITVLMELSDGHRHRQKKRETNLKLTALEVQSILMAYKETYELCQANFKMERWNCPVPARMMKAEHPTSLTNIYKYANKETSYVYSIVAAGIAHHMTRLCQMGRDVKCPCIKKKNGRGIRGTVTCSEKENIDYGFKKGKRVMKSLDYKHVVPPNRKLYNLRNINTGLKTLKSNLRKVCKCHGVSGHCNSRTCWLSTPVSLKGISLKLKKLYHEAKKLDVSSALMYKSIGGRKVRDGNVNNTGLVFLDESPDYCKANPKLGIPGTLNRECDHYNDETCTRLCGSCGYRKHSFVKIKENAICNCKFHWCCEVTCETCTERIINAKCAS